MGLFAALATGPDRPPRGGAGPDADIDTIFRRHRARVMVAVTLGYGIAYTCRLAINVVKKPLIDQGLFSPAELGFIGSVLLYSYAIGKLVNGFTADHANIKRFLALGVLLSALANVGMGFSTALWLTATLWGLNGWFQSVGAPACVVAMANWFSNRERGRFYGIWSTAHSIGEGLTFAVVATVAALLGWRWGFWAPGLACIGVAAAMYVLLADRPPTLGLPTVADWRDDHYAAATPAPSGGVFATQLSILRIPAVWILALASAAIYVTRYAVNSWGILYLQEARGYSLTQAGSMLTVSTLAGVAGAIGFGFLSDTLFGARRPPANLLFGAIELSGLCLVFYGPETTAAPIGGLVLFGFGMTGLVTTLGGLFAVDICPKRVAGAAVGLIGVFSYLGAGIQEQVSGILIQRGMHVVGGVRSYDFGAAILFWVGASVVSTLLAATLWRTKLRD